MFNPGKIITWIAVLVFVFSIGLNVVYIPKTIRKQPQIIKTETVYNTDTVYKYIENKVFIEKPTLDTVIIHDTLVYTNVYRDTIHNQDVDIIAVSRIQGVLQSQTFEYKLKFPEITKSEVTTTNEYIEVPTYKTGFYALGSLAIAPNNGADLFVGLSVITKGRAMVAYQYGLSSKSHMISFGYRF